MDIKKALLKNKTEILNISFCDNEDGLLDFIASYLDKIKIIQYNATNLSDNKNLKLASKIQQLCSFYNALFLINSRADFALILNSDGLFLDENDISIEQVKEIIHNNDKIIGASYISKNCDYTINNYTKENKIFKIG